jgi:hypothetical protein
MAYYNRLALPYNCHICSSQSVHQICTPCSEAFKRGLKTRLNSTRTYKNLDIHNIKFELGKYLTAEHMLPVAILMNQPTYHDYCIRNKNLPSSPPHEKADTLRSVHGIPIDIVDSKTYGYSFSDVSARLPTRDPRSTRYKSPKNSPKSHVYK